MHMRGVTSEQDAFVPVGSRLPSHIGEAGDPGRTMNPIIGSVDGDQRFTDIAQSRFARSDALFDQHDARSMLQLADCMRTNGIVAEAPWRLL